MSTAPGWGRSRAPSRIDSEANCAIRYAHHSRKTGGEDVTGESQRGASANYAATHCWTGGGSNVITYMTTHVPRMIDMERFQSGEAGLQISYFSQDPATGQLTPFVCGSGADCSASCVPDAVTVSVTSYQFSKGLETFFRLPPVTIPPFATSMPIQSAGCDESGNCLP
jgi:hypothetical protein